MIIGVHEVELQLLENSGRKHSRSVLGARASLFSGNSLLGSEGHGVAEMSKRFSARRALL